MNPKKCTYKRICLLVLMILLFGCTGCRSENEQYITCLDDMKNMSISIGYPDDLDLKDEILAVCPKAKLAPQNDILAIDSVVSGKLGCYIAGKFYLDGYLSEHPDAPLLVLDEPLIEYRVGLGLSDSAPIDNYVARVNECIAMLKSDGTLADMERRWLQGEDETMPYIPPAENPKYTLRVVTYGQQRPNTYYKNNKLVGLDIELSYRVASYLGCGVHFDTANYPSMLLGIAEGKYDMIAADLYITENRSENLTFSEPYQFNPILAIVKAAPNGEGKGATQANSFGRGLRNTFINESRWKMLLSGLGVTLLITLGGFILANLLGAWFCILSLSAQKIDRILADIYSRIMQGTPIVVVLLLLYYVVFGKNKIDGIWVAILGFGLSSGAGLAQLFYGGVTAVEKGQREAALALGFSKVQTFFGITFPQMVRTILPGYFSTLISLLKATSVVGFIAVVDMTKASDIIRSSTFEAFLPLLSVAVAYFLISFALLSVLKAIQKKLAPKRRTKPEVAK